MEFAVEAQKLLEISLEGNVDKCIYYVENKKFKSKHRE